MCKRLLDMDLGRSAARLNVKLGRHVTAVASSSTNLKARRRLAARSTAATSASIGGSRSARANFEHLAKQLAWIARRFILTINATDTPRDVFNRFDVAEAETTYTIAAASSAGGKRTNELMIRGKLLRIRITIGCCERLSQHPGNGNVAGAGLQLHCVEHVDVMLNNGDDLGCGGF